MLLQLQVIDELVENAYEGMVIVNADGIITKCRYEKLLGIKEKDVIGKNVSDVIENTRLQDVIKSGLKEIGDIQVINGHEMIASRIPIIRDNKIIGAVGTVLFKDLEELKYLAKRVGNETSSKKISKEEKKKIDQAKYSFDSIITQNAQMLSLIDLAKKASETNSTVLIYGESGTGKEYFSHAIHLNSKRKYGPFVRINCAAIPKELLESELFGYEEGAFTGAKKTGKIGKFEYANGGTIFLDEIGSMPLDMQAKLLRVLEEREFERVGGNKKIYLDIRVIAATNDSLPELVTKGKFREDLFYRLNVINIMIPPLRNRLDDIQILSESMLEMFSKYYKNAPKKISNGALELLKKYRWPGNLRELRNVIERSVTVSNGDMIFLKDLPEFISNITPERRTEKETYPTLKEMVREIEIKAIKDAIIYCGGNKSEAAKILGIHRTALYKKCEKIGIEL
jgi:transcriptional regulator with PAS, ATPase and Fis domain